MEIEGGNHAQFGWYGEQAGDGEATISPAEQQDQTVAATLAVLEAVSSGRSDRRACPCAGRSPRTTASAGRAPHGVLERERQRAGVELHDLDLEAVLTRRQRDGRPRGTSPPRPRRNETGDCRETSAAAWTVSSPARVAVTAAGSTSWPSTLMRSDAHERAVGQAVASLEAEAVTLVLEAAADVELADHEVGHAHPGSLAGRSHACAGTIARGWTTVAGDG